MKKASGKREAFFCAKIYTYYTCSLLVWHCTFFDRIEISHENGTHNVKQTMSNIQGKKSGKK
jgi:hypothetical protein